MVDPVRLLMLGIVHDLAALFLPVVLHHIEPGHRMGSNAIRFVTFIIK